jgi:hypothetical protein
MIISFAARSWHIQEWRGIFMDKFLHACMGSDVNTITISTLKGFGVHVNERHQVAENSPYTHDVQ